ncbi:MAG: PQQ-binding-like beta-propeller repeat protein [Christiangramia sp.]|uniref:outer membrane protein assembly factor BamB family protein n=1 Tax=Christiangramia sp. TaxID=1931228 RepID=UPI003241DC26
MRFLGKISITLLFLLPRLFHGQSGDEFQRGTLNFAVVTDTHIGKKGNNKGLQEIVKDINSNKEIDFVLHAGDVSDFGYGSQLEEAKRLMDALKVPYYIVPGNHDTGWSSSGGLAYNQLWKDQKFIADIQGVRFIGLSTGPYGRMSRGFVPRDQIRWLDSLVKVTPLKQPVIFLAHYPLNDGLSNYDEVIQRMQRLNTIAVFCGHGHINKLFNYGGILGVMTRTAQRRHNTLAYNIVELSQDSLIIKEVEPGTPVKEAWVALKRPMTNFPVVMQKSEERIPVNDDYGNAKIVWKYQDEGNIVSTASLWKQNVLFGNLEGEFKSVNYKNGTLNWKFSTKGPIYSSSAIKDAAVIFGSADSTIYKLNAKNGEILWRLKAKAPVLASPVIDGNMVFIGSSDSTFRALDFKTGKEIWSFTELEGFPASKPSIEGDRIAFGTWGKTLYVLNSNTGKLVWKWRNDDYSHYYSPAMCIPVIQNGKIYMVAPDEKLREFDLSTGKQTFVSDRFRVRESLGGNSKKDLLLAKTMQDSIVAWSTKNEQPYPVMKISGAFGNDFSASMPVFDNGLFYFGTTFGRVYAVNVEEKKIEWIYELSNDMINTLRPLSHGKVLATSVDGKIAIIKGLEPTR